MHVARASTALWYLATALAAWAFGYTVILGSDLWWHLAAGRLIWERGTLGMLGLVDSWSFTAHGRPWLHHEWLAGALYHGWVALLGQPSLVFWKWGLLVATFVGLFHLLRCRTGAPGASYLATVTAVAVAAPFLDVRPHLYSLLGYVVVLAVAHRPVATLWWLPAVFLVWVNLHGGFFFGLMALAVCLAADAAPRELRRLLPAAGLWLACAAVCLVNPNGWEAFAYPLRLALSSASTFSGALGEWRPPFVPGGMRAPLYPAAIALAFAAGLLLVVSAHARRHRRETIAALVLAALTLAMSLRSRRFITLFAISQALLLAPALALVGGSLRGTVTAFLAPPDRDRRARARRRGPTRGSPVPRAVPEWLGLAAAALAVVLGVFWLAPYPLGTAAFLPVTEADSFPVEMATFADVNGLTGNVFAHYRWGGYLHLRTQGRLKVFIDGRADTVFDDEIFQRYLKVHNREAGWREIVEASESRFVLWPRGPAAGGGVAETLLADGGWRLLHEDLVSRLLVRVGPDAPPLPEPLRPTPDSGFRELALGGRAMTQNRLAPAAVHFRRALELVPNLRLACSNLVRVEALMGDRHAALATARRCQSIYPDARLLAAAAGRGGQDPP